MTTFTNTLTQAVFVSSSFSPAQNQRPIRAPDSESGSQTGRTIPRNPGVARGVAEPRDEGEDVMLWGSNISVRACVSVFRCVVVMMLLSNA